MRPGHAGQPSGNAPRPRQPESRARRSAVGVERLARHQFLRRREHQRIAAAGLAIVAARRRPRRPRSSSAASPRSPRQARPDMAALSKVRHSRPSAAAKLSPIRVAASARLGRGELGLERVGERALRDHRPVLDARPGRRGHEQRAPEREAEHQRRRERREALPQRRAAAARREADDIGLQHRPQPLRHLLLGGRAVMRGERRAQPLLLRRAARAARDPRRSRARPGRGSTSSSSPSA